MESSAIGFQEEGRREEKQARQPWKDDIAERLSPGDKGARTGKDYLSRVVPRSFLASNEKNDRR